MWERADMLVKDSHVLSREIDPYMLDTPANHKLGVWFAEHWRRIGAGLHLRGYHYALLGTPMPNGAPYINDDDTWEWLTRNVVKAARWLGYVPFDGFVDERNEEPVIKISGIYLSGSRRVGVTFGVSTWRYTAPDNLDPLNLEPYAFANNFGVTVSQKYRLVLVGEKTSLRPVLGPISDRYDADLFLPTGEISDVQIYQMAKAGAHDGREMVVLAFYDFDPSGIQMPVSIAHKLRAMRDTFFPNLKFSVVRAVLRPEQVKSLRLPSTPLKESERRADAFRKAFGLEQTELDALATLKPEALADIARKAISPYYDDTLLERVRMAVSACDEIARQRLDAALEAVDCTSLHDAITEAHANLAESISVTQERAAAYNDLLDEYRSQLDSLSGDPIEVDLPGPELPEAPEPMTSSEWSLEEHVMSLRCRKQYSIKT
jgi:hypothetical protein